MLHRRGSPRTRDMFLLSGWLFADLLLALMMIFLISLNGGEPPPQPCGTPSPGAAQVGAQATGNALGTSLLTPLASGTTISGTNTSTGDTQSFATATPCPTAPTPTPTPFPCGLDLKNKVDLTDKPITVNDPQGLSAGTASGQQSFDDQIKDIFSQYADRTAGLVEVYGGGSPPLAGQAFAQSAIDALKLLGDQHPAFIFDRNRTFFQNLWNGDIGSNQVTLFVIFYYQSVNGACVQQ